VPTFTAVFRRGASVLFALLAATVLAASPVFAADAAAPAAAPAKPAKVEKAKKVKPATPAPKPRVAATPRAPKTPKPAPPPEQSIEEQRAADGIWMKRANWLGLRAGYAKAAVPNGGDGLAGYGMSYQHMISRQWSIGAAVQHDVVAHLGMSSEISVPFTVEMTRHFKWDTAIRPYLGFGGGYYFHKYYRTGTNDTGAPGSGVHISFGANMPLSDRHVLGLDLRSSFVGGRTGVVNPVFGAEQSTMVLWSAKLTWGMVY